MLIHTIYIIFIHVDLQKSEKNKPEPQFSGMDLFVFYLTRK